MHDAAVARTGRIQRMRGDRRRVWARAVLPVMVGALMLPASMASPASAEAEGGAPGAARFAAGQVASGYRHTCVIVVPGAVRCWGAGGSGQLGLGGTGKYGDDHGETPANGGRVALPAGTKAVAITAGSHHTCVVLDTGGVRCWGLNGSGQLGLGNNFAYGLNPGQTPATGGEVPLPAGTSAVAISAGGSHTCVVLDTGAVRCWGLNGSGQLGLGNTASYGDDAGETPANGGHVALPAGSRAVAVTAGSHHTCAVLDTGGVRCWGINYDGNLGLGNTDNHGNDPGETPASGGSVALPAGTRAVAIAAGDYHTCAVLDTGALRCWGYNTWGQLGSGSTASYGDDAGETPATGGAVALPAGTGAVGIAAGGDHTCAVLDSGALRCWGGNGFGQLGLGSTTAHGDNPGETPASGGSVHLPVGTRAVAVTTADSHTCAVLDTGALRCWGSNGDGQLGLGNTDYHGDNAGETPAVGGDVDLGPGVSIAIAPAAAEPPVAQPPATTPPGTPPPATSPPAHPVVGRPGTVRGLEVEGRPRAVVRTIRWRAPRTTGGTPITSYRVTVRATVKGRRTVIWATHVAAPAGSTALRVRVQRSRLRTGAHQVRVRATNTEHAGAWASRRFTVSR